jgi:hypothetical protein
MADIGIGRSVCEHGRPKEGLMANEESPVLDANSKTCAPAHPVQRWVTFGIFLVIGIASIGRGVGRHYDWTGIVLGVIIVGFAFLRLQGRGSL